MRVLSPTSDFPAWGSGIGRSPMSIGLWRPTGLECRNSTGPGETEIILWEDAHKVSCVLGTMAKQWLHRILGETYLWVLEGLLEGDWLWLTVGTRTLVVEAPGNIHWHELSWSLSFWTNQDLVPPTAASVMGRLRQNNKHGGKTTPPISRQAT